MRSSWISLFVTILAFSNLRCSPSGLSFRDSTLPKKNQFAVAESFNIRPRLMDRVMISEKLGSIFGKLNISTILESTVTNQISVFGGPCDPFEAVVFVDNGLPQV